MKKPKFKIGDIIYNSTRFIGNNEMFMVVAYTLKWEQPHYRVLSLNDNPITYAGDHIVIPQQSTNMIYRKAA